MTRTGTTKKADATASAGRLAKARAYLKAASEGLALLEAGEIADPVISNIVISAIAYADALTARFAKQINQKDHAAIVKLLRGALGNRFPAGQAKRLQRILDHKDEAQYGARAKRKSDAEKLLADVEKFAGWAETVLADRTA